MDAGFRGCAFIHASLQPAEAAGELYEIVHAYKLALREHLYGLIDSNARNRGELADQIVLLLDGAVMESYLRGVLDPMGAAKAAVAILLKSARR